jgi:curved DNA-binding protein CbpA
MNYYDVLGIPVDATPETIRAAFRNLARRYHPDVGEGSSAHRFREVVEAYETLSDPVRRRRYDLSLRRARRRPVPVEPMVTATEPEPITQRPRAWMGTFFHNTYYSEWDALLSELMRSIDDLFGPPFAHW